MERPIEYDNLVKNGTFKDAVKDPASIKQFMTSAGEFAASIKDELPPAPRFSLAYEGMFLIVMAVMEHYGARPGDGSGHRATAIGRVAADLELDSTMLSTLLRSHDNRNRITYKSSIPPVTKAQADAMVKILDTMLAKAMTLLAAKGEKEADA